MMNANFKSMNGELWEKVNLDCPYVKEGYSLEISNFGRVKSNYADGKSKLLSGGKVNGYNIIRLKFFKPRSEENQNTLEIYLSKIRKLRQSIKREEVEGTPKKYNELQEKLEKLIKRKDKFLRKETNERTINYQVLTHRLVAEYFLPKPEPAQSIVAHLDFDKLNNKWTNLRWMTQEENLIHQQKSPNVIKDLKHRKNRFNPNGKGIKLSETRVMFLKKLLNEGKPMKQLVRTFKVTETQILRIKRGENWAKVEASK